MSFTLWCMYLCQLLLTRQRINQSKNLLASQGKVEFKVLCNCDDKLTLLPEIKKFHISRWSGTATPSGFCNQLFSAVFKRQLTSEVCEVAVLYLSAQPIAILVNYRYRNHISFYLSALSEQYKGKIKLGLLIHSLAIQYYKNAQIEHYDFLAGQSQYKCSLSNNCYEQNMLCFRKKTLLNRLELILKKIKRYYQKKYTKIHKSTL